VPRERFGVDPLMLQGLSPAEELREKLRVQVISLDDECIVFDLVGADVSLANALRRIMLSEVPSVAIEKVYILDNSSIIHDEVLAHRLGLVPIKLDPDNLTEVDSGNEDAMTDANTTVFRMDVLCGTAPEEHEKDQSDPRWRRDPDTPYTRHVYSDCFEWVPQGDQLERFGEVKPVHDDILIAKLRPGQRIMAEMYCQKGVGKDHAKFSPVATASYRLLPRIVLTDAAQALPKDKKEELVGKCPMNVFDVEDSALVAARPRDCTMCRECIRGEEWRDKVKLKRVADHFIFSVETVGALPPEDIVRRAIAILKEKCINAHQNIQAYAEGRDQ